MYKRIGVVMLAGIVPVMGAAGQDPIRDGEAIVKAADWKQAQRIEVRIEEYEYAPDRIVLEAGKPYKLVIENEGEKAHYFTAPEFYKAVAWRKAEAEKVEVKAPYFKAFEIKPGGELELFFVAVGKGSFPVYCTIDDHRDRGMEGEIVVR
ncbi:cupredoxin domain-containing protein [Inmirania thermothiophila]|uniref:Cupredoxin-like protein n=1 Tax=Inmirania thermothiophila TaxID=1750597 RepID=A0A3N1XZM7_9GAMM|nr:cupredoxin domain-containing protein [Inmirania thermothiophila]ROR32046.1 cupredoxin-like protein [Inmirania thermothiophila]